MALQNIRPLQLGLPFGIRIAGLTLEQASDPAVRQEITSLFDQHGMIVFEDIQPSDELQLAISTSIGPLKEHPVKSLSRVDQDTMPGVIKIAVTPERGGIVELNGKQVSHWLPWHFDHCYNNELNRAGVLRALEIPPEGGLTVCGPNAVVEWNVCFAQQSCHSRAIATFLKLVLRSDCSAPYALVKG